MKLTNSSCIVLILMLTAGGCERELAKPREPTKGVVITKVSVPATCVQGDTVSVVITTRNPGNCGESVVILTDVTDRKEIGSQLVMIPLKDHAGMDADLIFTGDPNATSRLGQGFYWVRISTRMVTAIYSSEPLVIKRFKAEFTSIMVDRMFRLMFRISS